MFTVSITFSFLIIATYLLISNSSILEFFLGDFESGIFKLIFLSVFVSAIHSFYYPIYLEVLYKNNEVKLVRFNLLNYFFCTILYFFLSNNYTLNFLYIFLIYEVFNIIYIFFKFRNIANYKINLKSEINYISLSIFPVMIIIFNLIMNIEINQILIFISISCLIVDVIRFLKLNKLFFHKNR